MAFGKVMARPTTWLTINIILFAGLFGFELSNFVKPNWWGRAYEVALSILASGLVSFFFYWLVVYVPEQRKRRIIKDNLLMMYRNIKEGILYEVIFASQKGWTP